MSEVNFSILYLLAKIDLSDAFKTFGGSRAFTSVVVLLHIFWAQLFVGFALMGPVLQVGRIPSTPQLGRTLTDGMNGRSCGKRDSRIANTVAGTVLVETIPSAGMETAVWKEV